MITYNHEEYISKAIDSILMQNVDFNFEIIVGEDCSPDNTRDILSNYEEKYPNKIKIINRKENIGVTKNFHDVLMRCKGKYIAFLEGDDFWTDKYKMQKQVDFLEKNTEYIGVAHECNIVDKNDNVLEKDMIKTNKVLSKFLNNKFNFNDNYNHGQVYHTATLLMRNIFCDKLEDYSILHSASSIVGDRTLAYLLLDKGNLYIMQDNMSAYRVVREKNGTNALSISYSRPVESKIQSTKQLIEIERYFKRKYNFSSKICREAAASFLWALKMKTNKHEILNLFKEFPIQRKLRILFYIISIFTMRPIKLLKNSKLL